MNSKAIPVASFSFTNSLFARGNLKAALFFVHCVFFLKYHTLDMKTHLLSVERSSKVWAGKEMISA